MYILFVIILHVHIVQYENYNLMVDYFAMLFARQEQ